MKSEAKNASGDTVETQQAATTTYDVVETQALLKQLTGNTGGIYRKDYTPTYVRWLRSFAAWFRRRRPAEAQPLQAAPWLTKQDLP